MTIVPLFCCEIFSPDDLQHLAINLMRLISSLLTSHQQLVPFFGFMRSVRLESATGMAITCTDTDDDVRSKEGL